MIQRLARITGLLHICNIDRRAVARAGKEKHSNGVRKPRLEQ